MKKIHAQPFAADSLPPIAPAGNTSHTPKKRKPVAPGMPDEASVVKANAIAREYPFCVYHKTRKNDPL